MHDIAEQIGQKLAKAEQLGEVNVASLCNYITLDSYLIVMFCDQV